MKYDPAFCEREYNARAAVPDHAVHMRHRALSRADERRLFAR